MTLRNIINLLRIEQWVKNLFIFLPLFFDAKLFDITCLKNSSIAFVAMCFAASAVYCFNDIMDIDQDKLHPQKCKRPIASGEISIKQAYIIMTICIWAALGTSLLVSSLYFLYLIGILCVYWVINLLYCVWLKHIAIVDVMIVSTCYVLRVVTGGLVCGIYISHWIILMTFLLALFLAFAKRRDDIIIKENEVSKIRKASNGYNLAFLNQTLGIIASVTMVCYIMYAVSDDVCSRFNTQYLYITCLWVLAGIIRYLKLTMVDNRSGSPTKILLKDKFIQACILFWIINFSIIIYL
ncbi:MAG: decaprenyl-phosphate phosphoribosyltransferase [Bacteroidales bacterium]|nr:decaprenyl-phosphate phosphoribosyltransferase [Bacteroidales bacterium]